MRKGLRNFALGLFAVVLIILLLVMTLWQILPRWLPSVAKHWLPTGTSLSLSAPPFWSQGVIHLPGLRYFAGDCLLLQAEDVRLQNVSKRWDLRIARLNIDTICLNKLPKSADSDPVSVAWLQNNLPAGSLAIDKLAITPWQQYAGQVYLVNNQNKQHIMFRGNALTFDAVINAQRQLTLNAMQITPPGSDKPWQLKGELNLPATLDQLPQRGELHSEIQTTLASQPLDIMFSWQQDRGELRVNEKNNSQPLLQLPWTLQQKQLQIIQGQWRWPYATQPLSGGIGLTFSEWDQAFNQTTVSGRLNVLTQGHNGKANVVLTLKPGKIGLLDSDLLFQLTGQANLQAMSLSASLPGKLSGSILNPLFTFRSGALLRAWGKATPTLTLQDARLPLAGVNVSAEGISGPLQSIVRAHESYWGAFQLHLSGKAQKFWPDRGLWDFNYWGKGRLPPLSANWDMSGKGSWHDNVVTLSSLSTGFARMSYGLVSVEAPRLTLQQPMVWVRPVLPTKEVLPPNTTDINTVDINAVSINSTDIVSTKAAIAPKATSLNGEIKLVASRIALSQGGYLPATTLVLTLKGNSPQNFTMRGMLDAKPIGPIRLTGRWDGERLRGEGWWSTQPLTAFQSLLKPELNMKLREGTFRAQSAFSVARGQGFVAGGHWTVKDGGMWLKDGDLSGLDFSLSYRFKNQAWQFGTKKPVSLHIRALNNLFTMENITADLQGSYPWSEQAPLRLSGLSVDMLRGQISLSELRMPQNQAAVLKLSKVDLSEVFTVLKPKQLAMSGVVNGELPLFFNDPKWLIRDGWIENDGWLTLRLDKQFADAMASGNLANRVVVELLRYMEIHRSYAKVNLDNLGELNMEATVDGVNNTGRKKREVILNYHHQENIYQLWRSLRFGDNLQEWLQQEVALPSGS